MAIDRTAFRAAVTAAVRAWANTQAAARGLDLSDPRTRAWVESLIRYRLRQGLPPAPDRGAIPGDIGIAEIGDGPDDVGEIFSSGLFDYQGLFGGLFREAVFLTDVETNAVSGWLDSELLANSLAGGGPATCSPLNDAEGGSIIDAYSGRYTGEMRRVVQLIHGMGKPVLYGHCWDRTHGIFVASNGDRYVIEISESAGITAWALPINQTLDGDGMATYGVDVPYIPTPVDRLPVTGNRIELLSAGDADFEAAFATSPYFSEQGWAFAADGHTMVNTSWSWPDSHKRYHRWSIAISESDNAPSSAALVETDTGYLWAQAAVKVPQYTASGARTLAKLDLTYDESAPSWSNIPLFAYFAEGESSTPTVWYIKRRAGYSSSTNDTPWWTISYCGIPSDGGTGGGTLHTGGTRVYVTDYYFDAAGGPSVTPQEQPWSSTDITVQVFTFEQVPGELFDTGNTPGRVYSEMWIGEQNKYMGGNSNLASGAALIVPWNERCGMYLFTGQHERIQSATDRLKYRRSMVKGTYWDDVRRWYASPEDPVLCDCWEPQGPADEVARYRIGDTPAGVGVNLAPAEPFSVKWGPFGFEGYPDTQIFCYTADQNPAGEDCREKSRVQTNATSCSGVWESGNFDVEMQAQQTLDFYDPSNTAHTCFDADEYTSANAYQTDVAPSVQVIEARIEAFTGTGVASAAMGAATPANWIYIGAPETYYPMEEIQTTAHGWFGSPIPALIE